MRTKRMILLAFAITALVSGCSNNSAQIADLKQKVELQGRMLQDMSNELAVAESEISELQTNNPLKNWTASDYELRADQIKMIEAMEKNQGEIHPSTNKTVEFDTETGLPVGSKEKTRIIIDPSTGLPLAVPAK